jgi:cell division protein FtsQ
MSARAPARLVGATGGDRRFRRATAPARRRARARTIPWHALGTAAAAIGAIALTVLAAREVGRSVHFQVQRITVRGNDRLSTGEALALLDGLQGRRMFDVDLEPWRQRLLASPWVADVRLRRVLPTGIDVAIVERVPLALARADGRLFLVDGEGAVIDEYGPRYADIDLPIIDGLSPGADGPSADSARTTLVVRLLADLEARGDLLGRVSQIDVRDERNAIVMLAGDATRLHVGDTAFADRLQSYLELAPALTTRVPEIDYVDMRFEPRVFVRPLTKPGGSGRTEGGSQP